VEVSHILPKDPQARKLIISDRGSILGSLAVLAALFIIILLLLLL